MYCAIEYNSTHVNMYNENHTQQRQRTTTNAYLSFSTVTSIVFTICRKLHKTYGRGKIYCNCICVQIYGSKKMHTIIVTIGTLQM